MSKLTIDYLIDVFRPHLENPDVFEIRINRFGEIVLDTRNGRLFIEDQAISEDYINKQLLRGLANYNGSNPDIVNNLKLPDGSRAIICQPPAVIPGSTAVAIRKHMPVTKTLNQLAKEGRFNNIRKRNRSEMAELDANEKNLLKLLEKGEIIEFLRGAVKGHLNIAVTGSTGSGKTTLTRTLIDEVDVDERIILLEDVHEIAPSHHKEIVFLQYGDSLGRISPTECLKACMRLSPERIFMTELRDSAAWDLLAGANTAHPGIIFSTHADDAATAFGRISDLVKGSPIGSSLDYRLIMKRVETTLDVVIHMANWEVKEILYDPLGKKRKLAEPI